MTRPVRLTPADLSPDWPSGPSGDGAGEVARLFALNLQSAIGPRSVREVAKLAEVNHATVLSILKGRVWADAATIAKLEIGLGRELWPRFGSPESTGRE